MKWLKKKLRRWVNSDDSVPVLALEPVHHGVDIDGMTFNVMKANGGVIVQTRNYDRKTDRNNYNTYIIHDEESVVERVGQIVALEILKS